MFQQQLKYIKEKKGPITAFVVVIVVLLGILCFLLPKTPEVPDIEPQEALIDRPVLVFFGQVKEVNLDKMSLIVEPNEYQGEEVELVVDDDTVMVKLKSPFSLDNPPKVQTAVKLAEAPVGLDEFKEGDNIFVRTYGIIEENKIGKVDFIKIKP